MKNVFQEDNNTERTRPMVSPHEFERIARENERRLYTDALFILRSHADAEDAAEEAIYRLFSKKPAFESEEHCRAWLIRVTVNAALKMLKRNRRYTADSEALEETAKEFEYPEQSEIFLAVAGLDEKYRTVIMLYYYEEMTAAEIAKVLSITTSAVTTRLSRARELLKKTLLKGENYNG